MHVMEIFHDDRAHAVSWKGWNEIIGTPQSYVIIEARSTVE